LTLLRGGPFPHASSAAAGRCYSTWKALRQVYQKRRRTLVPIAVRVFEKPSGCSRDRRDVATWARSALARGHLEGRIRARVALFRTKTIIKHHVYLLVVSTFQRPLSSSEFHYHRPN
jgi:hypothetical protein